jgi:drug/metabolite transporter (DMT)-like permease
MLFVSFIAGTAITAVYYMGIRIIGSKKSSAFSILTPFFAIALGAIFFEEGDYYKKCNWDLNGCFGSRCP